MEKETFIQLLSSPNLVNEQTLPGLREVVNRYPWFRAGSALYAKNLKNTGDTESATFIGKASLLVLSRQYLQTFLEKTENTIQYFKPDSRKKADIIDRFIKEEPRIVSVKDYIPAASLEQDASLEEKDEIVSETLARLFHQQGNRTRAIKIYEKLMLKNPEKSSYFAGQIEKIKKESNSIT